MIFGMQMTSAETAPYGEWPSPISGADVARMQVSLAVPDHGGHQRLVAGGAARTRTDGWPSSARGRTGSAVTCSRCRGTPGRGSTSTAASRTYQCRAGSCSRTSPTSGCTAARKDKGGLRAGTADGGAERGGRRPVRRLRALPGRGRGVVRAGTARYWPGRCWQRGARADQPGDRGRPAGRVGRRPSCRDQGADQRFGLLRLPDAVARRRRAGLDLLGSSPDAVGRHRTPGRGARRRRAGQRQEPAAGDHGLCHRVRAGSGLARRPQPVRDVRPVRMVEPVRGGPARLPAGPVPAGGGSSPAHCGSWA